VISVGNWAPTRADLDMATERTARVMARPDASPAVRLAVAELEEGVHNAYVRQSLADAELQREAEAEWEPEAGS